MLCCLLHRNLLTTTLLHDILLHLERSSCHVVGSSAGSKLPWLVDRWTHSQMRLDEVIWRSLLSTHPYIVVTPIVVIEM